MKLPLSWLKELIHLTISPEEIAEKLTMIGLEVEAIETTCPPFENVVVGRVIECEKHPNADSLRVAKVTDGEEVYQVVCGAPNCRAGIKVAYSRVGSTLTDEAGNQFLVKKAKLRGVESFGMLCSERELQLSDEHEGILELPESFEEGMDLKKTYQEIVFDISLTPNLAHCSSVMGVARELAAVIEQPYQTPKGDVTEDSSTENETSVEVKEPEKCPRYTCRVIHGVKVGSSPVWLRRKLELSGIRSVNNVVDSTNYVLLELGHPLHAFDLNRLDGGKIVVRTTEAGERLVTLDDEKRDLVEGTLVVCDATKPVALAGVMGGKESEVNDSTTDVLLESAYFDPPAIRRASKEYGILTDASKKFERGCDPNSVIPALNRATAMIQSLAGGKVACGVIDQAAKKFENKKIQCRFERVNKILGTQLSPNEVESVFQRLNFSYTINDEVIVVEVPTFRVDIHAEIDLIEEVARFYGYDHIPIREAYYQSATTPHAPIFLFEREVRQRLISEGLQDVITCDLISPELISLVANKAIPEEIIIPILNPTSSEQSILRPSLLPGMLQMVRNNLDFKTKNLSIFEVGRIHVHDEEQYKEQSVAGVLLTGETRPHHWDEKRREIDFYDLKGIIENVFASFHIDDVSVEKHDLQTFHPGRQAAIKAGDVLIGSLGEVHPALLRKLDIGQRVYYAEFNLHDVISRKKIIRRMRPLPHFPSSERDWTITLKEDVKAADIFGAIHALPSTILESVTLIDLYRCEERIGKDCKNLTFRFVYRDAEKTLSQGEVDQEHARLTEEALPLLGKSVV